MGNGGNALNSHLYQQKKREKLRQSSRKTLYNQNWNWSNRTKRWDEMAYGLTTSHEIKVSMKGDFGGEDQFRCFTIL